MPAARPDSIARPGRAPRRGLQLAPQLRRELAGFLRPETRNDKEIGRRNNRPDIARAKSILPILSHDLSSTLLNQFVSEVGERHRSPLPGPDGIRR